MNLTTEQRQHLTNLLHEVGFEAYLHFAEEQAHAAFEKEAPASMAGYAWSNIVFLLADCKEKVAHQLTYTDE